MFLNVGYLIFNLTHDKMNTPICFYILEYLIVSD